MKKSLSVLVLFCLLTSLASAADLTLEMAQKIAAKVAACGKKNNWKLSVAIVNSEGNLLYFQRGDGSYPASIQASIEKAKSANNFQRPTKAFVDGIKEGRIGLVSMPGLVGVEGGVPIKSGDKFIGGLGVSGARSVEDEQCAEAALK